MRLTYISPAVGMYVTLARSFHLYDMHYSRYDLDAVLGGGICMSRL